MKWNDPAIPARLVKQLCRVRHLFGQGASGAALKGGAQPARPVYEDAREINWCSPDAAYSAIARIMQR